MGAEGKVMATPGQLVQATADALGLSRATVFLYDRVLAENGLRSKGGRGTSAAKVTSRDVANLLTAIGGSYSLALSSKDAAKIRRAFSTLTSVGPAAAKKHVAKLGLKSLASLPDGHSFGEALTALIQCAGGREFSAMDDSAVWIQFIGPIPAANMVVGSMLFGNYISKYKRSPRSARLEPGLVHASSMRTSVIRALGALVFEPGHSNGH
jgi:hypothetical protein